MFLRRLFVITLCGLLLPTACLAAQGDLASPALSAAQPHPRLMQAIDTGAPLPAVGPREAWLYIDLRARSLTVFQGHKVVLRIGHVAIGRNGARRLRLEGSRMTPTGTYRIDRINPDSRFHRFFELDYPNPATARDAMRQGLISMAEAQRINQHYLRYRVGLPSTSLGGYIGIHGLGGRSPYLNRRMDWTDGCLAVTDAEIDKISRWVKVGTQVVISG